MKKNYTTTLIMAVCLVGLSAWYLIYELKFRPEGEIALEKQKQLLTFEKDQIQEITIERNKAGTPDYETIILKKAGNDWNLTAPLADQADPGGANGMATMVVGLKQERVVSEKPTDLAQYGLTTPYLKITLKKDGNTPAQKIQVGDNTQVGNSSYVKVGDKEAVVTTAQTVRSGFDKSVKDIRSKSVVPLQRFQIAEVEIQNSKENIVLKKDDKDSWTLLRDNAPADVAEWNKTLNAIVDLRAVDFPTEKTTDLSAYGLKSPKAKITLKKVGDQTKVGLIIGQVRDKTFAKRDDRDTVFEVGKDIVARLDTPSWTYRDMHLAQFNRFDIKKFKVQHGKDSFELKKDGAAWSLTDDANFKVDGAKIDTFLTKLQDMKVSKFGQKDAKISEPFLDIKLFEDKDVEKVHLQFAKPEAKQVAGVRTGLPLGFFLKEEDFKLVDHDKKSFELVKVSEDKKNATPPVVAPLVKSPQKK